MLQKLNERVKGIFAWIVVILIALTFMLFGVDYFLESRQSSTSVAEVNGQSIPSSVFEQVYRRLRHQDASTMSAPEDETVKKQIVEELIINTLTLQAALQAGFYISPELVTSTIMRIPQFQDNGKFSIAKYQQVLAASMYTPSALSNEMGQDMLINQQRFMVVKSDFVLPFEIKKYAELLFETRDYQYAMVSLKPFIEKVKVSDDEARVYYESHAKQFITPPRVSLDYVMLSMDQFKTNTQVSDAEIRQYYQDNLASFKSPARWKVTHLFYAFPENATAKQQDHIKQKAQDAYETLTKTPALFNEWVKTKSDDKLSAQHEGVLPWLTLGQTPFDDALLTLNKVGQLSAPFKTKNGYELFKVLQYVPETVKPFAQAEVAIRAQLSNEKAQTNYSKALETLGEISYQNPDTLEPVAKALHLPIFQTQPFSKTGGTEMITMNPEVLRLAFSADVKDLGNNSEPIQINPTTVVVIRVKKQLAAESEPFAAVRSKIEQIIKTDTAKKEVDKLAQQVMKGQALPTSFKWQQLSNESRTGETKNPLIRDLAFKLPNNKEITGSYLPNGDYVFVQLNAIHAGKFDALDQAQRNRLTQQLQTAYGTIDYDLYVRELVDGAKIKRFKQ